MYATDTGDEVEDKNVPPPPPPPTHTHMYPFPPKPTQKVVRKDAFPFLSFTFTIATGTGRPPPPPLKNTHPPPLKNNNAPLCCFNNENRSRFICYFLGEGWGVGWDGGQRMGIPSKILVLSQVDKQMMSLMERERDGLFRATVLKLPMLNPYLNVASSCCAAVPATM